MCSAQAEFPKLSLFDHSFSQTMAYHNELVVFRLISTKVIVFQFGFLNHPSTVLTFITATSSRLTGPTQTRCGVRPAGYTFHLTGGDG